jgi:tRNA threonylcarbamoyladenosine biosynthesis protein TsaE
MLFQNNILYSEEDSKIFAKSLFNLIQKPPFVICFYGSFGVGKTFISREIIRLFYGKDINVTSPTFNLLNIYGEKGSYLYHYDLHRLDKLEEVYELSIEDALESHISLVEWPEIIESILPNKNRINVKITYNSDNTRSYAIELYNE